MKQLYHFLGGLLKHARAYTAVCNPTVNSYKRLVPGYVAPVYVAWVAVIAISTCTTRIARFIHTFGIAVS